MAQICREYGISRQGYYKKQRNDRRKEEEHREVLAAVKKLRHKLPKIGCRKLKYLLSREGNDYGRDKLFELLREEGMLIKRKKKYYNTTDSSNGENRYENLVKGIEIKKTDQVYVSDITYIRIKGGGFKYLSLVTDLYSRKILGYDLSDQMTTEMCIRAIHKAIGKTKGMKEGIIHHSDRGAQYSSNEYRSELESLGIRMSMSRKGNPYENAIAERVIGTLKREYSLGKTFYEHKYLGRLIEDAVYSYNTERPHMSLNYKTPEEVYNSNFVQATPVQSYSKK